jgi:SAM-dependent methyltransferase
MSTHTSSLKVKVARTVIQASHAVPRFRPRPSYSSLPRGSSSSARFDFEFGDSENFLENIPNLDFPAFVRGKSVLDFGSGYGGRTAWIAQWARSIVGVEIFEAMVQQAARCASDVPNCRFVRGEDEAIGFPDESFDLVVSFDVLEHVTRPDTIMREWYRVLKPGGAVLVIFTPYEGAFSHHLNYISLAPGLQWMFDADTLMAAVRQLADGPMRNQIDLKEIPTAHTSYDGARRVLPTLNGLTKPAFLRHVRDCGFRVERATSRGVLEKYPIVGRPGKVISRALCRVPRLDARLAHNLTALLTKPKVD